MWNNSRNTNKYCVCSTSQQRVPWLPHLVPLCIRMGWFGVPIGQFWQPVWQGLSHKDQKLIDSRILQVHGDRSDGRTEGRKPSHLPEVRTCMSLRYYEKGPTVTYLQSEKKNKAQTAVFSFYSRTCEIVVRRITSFTSKHNISISNRTKNVYFARTSFKKLGLDQDVTRIR